MLTFLHAADLHLDSPFHALPPEQAAQRRREQRQLLGRLAQTARENRADLIFLAGDIFDSQRVRPETLQALEEFFEALEAPVFLAPGNHDPYTDASPYSRRAWPGHVHIFSTPSPERVVLPQLGVTVYGSAFVSPYRMEGPLTGFRVQEEDGVTFGCFHGDLSSPHSRYGPITQGEVAASGLTYLALGHSHAASGLQRAGRTSYAWPGCPEGRGFDETGDKGVYLGRLEGDKLTLDFLPLALRRYLTPALDITGRDPVQVLSEFLASANPADILRLRVVGAREEDNAPDLAALTALAADHCYHVTLSDQTTLSQSLWARREEDTLTGLFLRGMAQRLQEAAPEDRPLLERAVRFGLAALEGREEPT